MPEAARLGAIDLLRGICALAVFAFHEAYQLPVQHAVPWQSLLGPITRFGFLGVPIFFMISGYVISKSAESRTRLQFAASRAGRLLPGFWMALSLTLVVLLLMGAVPPVATIAANFIIVATWFRQPYVDGVYWSLTAEIFFYGAVMALAVGSGFRPRMRCLSTAWMMLTVGNWFVHIPAAVILNFPWAPYFAIGIFMYFFVSEGWRGDMLMLLTSGAIAGVQTFIYQRQFGGSTVPFCLNAAFVMEVGAALLFILQGCRLSHGMQRVAIVVGAMSYPLYLIHDVLGTVVMTTLYGISPG